MNWNQQVEHNCRQVRRQALWVGICWGVLLMVVGSLVIDYVVTIVWLN